MTPERFKSLSRGDIVRHVDGVESYIVESVHCNSVTLIRSIEASNPCEWDLVLKAIYAKPRELKENE